METLLAKITDHPILTALAALFLWTFTTSLTSYTRLAHIPGPRLAALSNFWMVRASASTRLDTIFATLAATHGPVVRTGPNQVLTSNLALLSRTGAVRGAYARDDWYVAFRFQPWVDNVFNMRAVAAHDARKAQVAVGYNISGREVELVEPSVDAQVRALVALLRGKYVREEGLLCDFGALTGYLTLDVITRAAFGRAFGHLREDADVTGYLGQLRAAWPVVGVVSEWPELRRLFFSTWYLRAFGPKVTDEKGLGKIMSAVTHIVEDRFKGTSKAEDQKDMLSSWMHHGLSDQECVAEALLALAAGSETTASVMRITLLSLLTSPPAYQKLKVEIRHAVRNGGVADPISFTQAKALPYLRAVVMEGMRMRPGTVGAFPKIVPPQGDTVDGYFLPGGTLIAVNIPAVLQDVKVFGNDAAIFRPERWLEAAEAQRTEMVSAVEMMFGPGRWMCAGKPIAYMELYKTFFELFRNFDFYLGNPTKPLDSKCYNVYVEGDMWVRVTEALGEESTDQ